MKKFAAVICLLCCLHVQAQFVNQLTLKKSFTVHEADSVLTAATGISGIFPLQYPVNIYKVIYNTVAGDSTPTTASGLMAVPVGAPCKVPMMSYQHGTTTKKNDVPSRFKGEWFIALAAASKGYVALMPDYLGLGDGPGMHPYQHAQSEATCVIDLIRAAKEVIDTMGAAPNDQLFLFGYSQGGHATMAAHQMIQEKFDNTMHVTASAPMSGAYDMSGVMSDVMVSDSAYPAPYYLPYLLLGFNSVYHLFAQDSDVFTHPYDASIPPLYDGTHSGGDIDAIMPQVPKLVMRQDQIDSFVNYPQTNFFRIKLRESDTYNWTPNSPVRMFYCQGDHSVLYQNAIVAYQHFKQNGATMIDTVDVNPTLDHYPCAQFAILGGVYWFDSLTYKPLSSTASAVNSTSSSSPNGSVTATGVLGNAPYTFNWSTGDTSETVSNLNAGIYYVTITDRSLCTTIDSATVQLISGLQNEVLNNVRIYPNPSRGDVLIENTNACETISEVNAFDLTGRQVRTYLLKSGNNVRLLFETETQGIYTLQIKSKSGKENRLKLTLF